MHILTGWQKSLYQNGFLWKRIRYACTVYTYIAMAANELHLLQVRLNMDKTHYVSYMHFCNWIMN